LKSYLLSSNICRLLTLEAFVLALLIRSETQINSIQCQISNLSNWELIKTNMSTLLLKYDHSDVNWHVDMVFRSIFNVDLDFLWTTKLGSLNTVSIFQYEKRCLLMIDWHCHPIIWLLSILWIIRKNTCDEMNILQDKFFSFI
jgi:hypothetical protein